MNSSLRLRSLLDMYKIDASQLVALANTLGASEVAIKTSPNYADNLYPEKLRLEAIAAFEPLREPLLSMELPVSAGFLNAAIITLEQKMAASEVEKAHAALNKAIEIELESKRVLGLTQAEAQFFEPSVPLFGNEVSVKFPGVAYEIDEAGKCYALSRSTASAFHSIRCLEAGIRAINKCLNIPAPTKGSDRNWSSIQRKITAVIEAKWPTPTDRFSGDGKLFDGLMGTFAAIQNPYRNETMHLDAKYTPEEALHIFDMVKMLMKKIASRMDEDGLPLA